MAPLSASSAVSRCGASRVILAVAVLVALFAVATLAASSQKRCYYEVLMVAKSATLPEIKKVLRCFTQSTLSCS